MVAPGQQTRKRRRPPLACVECRRRKVRCDRNKPCAQCVQQKSASCVYTDYDQTTANDQAPKRPRRVVAEELRNRVAKQPPHNSVDGWAAEGASTARASPPLPLRANGQSSAVSARSGLLQDESASSSLYGSLSKTRVFGHGHWMSTFPLVEQLSALDPVYHVGIAPSQETNNGSIREISNMVVTCKQLARDIKRQHPSRSPLPSGICQSFPDRVVTDHLVQLYFDTFESCYRILHLPLFRREYEKCMEEPVTASSSFVVKLLLVMSNAACLHGDATVRDELRVKARGWIHIAQNWLSAPVEKDRLTLEGIQIHCLLLLARQVNRVGADLVWISAGSLVRMAMQMAFHQDPNHLGEMTVLQKEIRRRLWYTILEMNLQAALDSGMSPTITVDEYDTQPPSDLDDIDLDQASQTHCLEKVASMPTRVSFQRLLASSIPLRLEATRVINTLREEPPYDRVLHLGAELVSACRKATVFIDRLRLAAENLWPTEFPHNCCEHFHRRFLQCLHFPYAVKAVQNPIYSYSAKVCLEASLDLVSLLDDETYRRLLLAGGGMFRDILTRGSILIFVDLITKLEEADNYTSAHRRNRARRELLLQDARKAVQYAQDRILDGETNVKGYVFMSMAMGQAEALLNGLPPRDAVIKSARDSLAVCHHMLTSMAGNSLSSMTRDPDLASCISSDINSLSSGYDTEFDFLSDWDLNFDLPGSWFLRQWENQA